jgi:hypothetical protein
MVARSTLSAESGKTNRHELCTPLQSKLQAKSPHSSLQLATMQQQLWRQPNIMARLRYIRGADCDDDAQYITASNENAAV